MSELSKYFKSETREIMRSQVTPAPYNPRTITKQARAALKANVKKHGVIGGMVWNEFTGNLVSGHQKLDILDELNKYDSVTNENDYSVKVEVIYCDEKTEKELNIFFNSPSAQGEWDYDMLRDVIGEIDYKQAGLSDEDLQIIGVDIQLQTDGERSLIDGIEEMGATLQQDREANKESLKAKKSKVLEQAEDKVEQMNAYVVINFDSYKDKSAFMLRFGFPATEKYINGNLFSDMIEKVE